MATVERSSSKGQAWFCTTGLPSDIIIEVGDISFHLHKFPLMSKSRKFHEMITEQENEITRLGTTTIQKHQRKFDNDIREAEIQEEHDENDETEEQCYITLPYFPGGSESFEIAAKFCYGVKIDISATNAAPLRCAGEYLEMTEEYSEENLISKTEIFFAASVFKNIKHSLKALISTQKLMPMADNLGIVDRCIDVIAAKAAASDPSLFGWPVNDGATKNRGKRFSNGNRSSNTNSWLDELGNLNLQFFQRLIFAMRASNLSLEVLESCLIHYLKNYIPGISRSNRKQSSSSPSVPTEHEQRELLETIISNLSTEKMLPSISNATQLLFGLLRTAYILNASENCKLILEKKIGSHLDQATLDDLLIPSYSYLNETLYDVDCVERILEYFLHGLEDNRIDGNDENTAGIRSSALMVVGTLIDGYLSEIASDSNLKPEKFYDLAIALPDHARLFDDGLYRAIDIYFKAHPWISDTDREKICGILDCEKLTLEACSHATQNGRLPLRAVVQVLFFEQLQLRHAITGNVVGANMGAMVEARQLTHGGEEHDMERAVVVAGSRGEEWSRAWGPAVRENQVLRLDMDSMRTRVHELERECTSMRKVIDKMGPKERVEKSGWMTKFGCKFKTQVCDSHQRTVVEARRVRRNRSSP